MLDQHVHCKYSPDSSEEISNYVKVAKENGDPFITITDHFDIFEKLQGKLPFDHDYIYHITKQYEEFDFNQDYVKLGIEVGFNPEKVEFIKEFLSKRNYSVILLSIHEIDPYGIVFMKPESYLDNGISYSEVVSIYYDQMYQSITSGIDYDVLTHMGYVFRYVQGINYLDYKEDIKKILTQVIKDDKIIEINTGCIRYEKYDTYNFYLFLLKLYKDLGGKKVTLNSDAHRVEDYNGRFDDGLKVIKEAGFEELYYVIDRTEIVSKI